ncbi:MAG: hypothetical protein GX132_05260 [Erysipelotrichia bacterium]|nr:hypothetical protein [Erysipelotrichia bacterium]
MGLIIWLLKPKRKMAKKYTRPMSLGKYIIRSHAQNRVVEKDRKISKKDVPINLFTKPIKITKTKYENKKPSYKRIGKMITTSINPKTNYVVSVWRTSSKKKGK